MLIAEVSDQHFAGGPHLRWVARSWSDVLDVCIARQVDAILSTGDFFEDPCHALGRDSSAGDVHRAAIGPTQREGAPDIYILPGNHDIMDGHAHALEVFRAVPGWTVVDSPQVLRLAGREEGGGEALVAFLPWEWSGVLMEDPANRSLPPNVFADVARAHNISNLEMIAKAWGTIKGPMKILAGHAEIDGAVNRYRQLPDGQYYVFGVSELMDAGPDVLSFGHYHKRQAIDGIQVYTGSLTQNNRGEEGNPTGFSILNTETGAREWVDIDCPRHYTVRLGEYGNDVLSSLTYFREGEDRAWLVGAEAPSEKGRPIALPRGMVFEKEAGGVDVRRRADGVTTESGTGDLLIAWLRSQGAPPSNHFILNGACERCGRVPQNADEACPRMVESFRMIPVVSIIDELAALLEITPVKPHSETTPGGLERLNGVRLWNAGPHEDTCLTFPAAGSGLVAYVGETGVGKSLLFEAPVAVWTGEFPQYDANFYDLATAKNAGGEFDFCAGGKRWLARREVSVSGGKSSRGTAKCYLAEVVDPEFRVGEHVAEFMSGKNEPVPQAHDKYLRHVAGPKEKDFLREMRLLLGDPDRFLATVFQAQNDSGGIVEMDPPAAMAFMRRIVGADRFDAAWKTANDRAKAARMTLAKGQGRVEGLGDVEAALAVREEEAALATATETAETEALAPLKDVAGQFTGSLQALHDRTREASAWRESHERIIADGKRVRGVGDALKAEVEALDVAISRRGELESQAIRVRELEAAIAMADKPRPADTLAADRAMLEERARSLRAQVKADEDAARASYSAAKAELQREFDLLDAGLRSAKKMASAALDGIVDKRERLAPSIRSLGAVACAGLEGGPLLACQLLANAVAAPDEDARLAVVEADMRAALADGSWLRGPYAADIKIGPLGTDGIGMNGTAADAWKTLRTRIDSWAAFDDADAAKATVAPREELASVEVELAALAAPPPTDDGLASLRKEREGLPSADSIARQLGQVEAAEAAHPIKRAELLVTDSALQRSVDAFRASQAAEVKAPTEADIRWAAQQLQDAERRVGNQDETIRKASAASGKAQANVEAAAARVKERDDLLVEVEKLKAHVAVKEVVEDFLAPRGVPQLLIDLAVPQINDAIAGIMATSIDGYRMRIDTQWVSPGGAVQEGLFVLVDGPRGERQYKAHSGGQKSLMRKVLRIGFGEYEAQRHGAGHKVLFTDEPTIGLSEQYVSRFMETICALTSGRLSQIIIVEHSAAGLAMVPTKFLLTQENGRVVVGRA